MVLCHYTGSTRCLFFKARSLGCISEGTVFFSGYLLIQRFNVFSQLLTFNQQTTQ